MAVSILFVTYVAYRYLNSDPVEPEPEESYYLSTIVYKDTDDQLIPISLNLYSETDIESEVRNRVDTMKSEDLTRYGLYPVVNSELQVQGVETSGNQLIVDFNDALFNNVNDLDTIEALTYMLTDYEGIDQLILTVNGDSISTFKNSLIPVSNLTPSLGLNNFEYAADYIHETIPVTIFSQKIIDQYVYYVPLTLRISEKAAIFDQVNTILSYVNNEVILSDAQLNNNLLSITIEPNVLLGNERLDQTLEDLIILSLITLPEVNEIEIVVNAESIETKNVSEIQYNYVKL